MDTKFDDEVTLYYQPIVKSTNGDLLAFEALLRPCDGAADETFAQRKSSEYAAGNLLNDLDRWVIHRALDDGSVLREHGIDAPIHVNVALADLDRGGTEQFTSWIDDLGDQGGRAVVEILENTPASDAENLRSVIDVCHHTGIRVAFDDFGTGYASLLALQQLQPDIVKIDKKFVRDLLRDKKTRAIVHMLIDLAHKLGISVVAEGVEGTAQWEWLRLAGCDEIQGFVVAKALRAPDEIISWNVDWTYRMQDARRRGLPPTQAAETALSVSPAGRQEKIRLLSAAMLQYAREHAEKCRHFPAQRNCVARR